MSYITAVLSSQGGRHVNEDCYAYRILPGGAGCWAVADGLGGHRGGDIAARQAVRACIEHFAARPGADSEVLQGCFQAGQAAVERARSGDPRRDGMRTTLTVLVAAAGSARWAHVGDTRLYAFRDGKVAAQTRDHSVPQVLADAGEIGPEDIRGHEDRNRLLRDLGGDRGVRPALREAVWRLRAGDAFLLCSDGFWETVTEAEMEADLRISASPGAWLDAMAARIEKNLAAGYDNHTAIALWVGVGDGAASSPCSEFGGAS